MKRIGRAWPSRAHRSTRSNRENDASLASEEQRAIQQIKRCRRTERIRHESTANAVAHERSKGRVDRRESQWHVARLMGDGDNGPLRHDEITSPATTAGCVIGWGRTVVARMIVIGRMAMDLAHAGRFKQNPNGGGGCSKLASGLRTVRFVAATPEEQVKQHGERRQAVERAMHGRYPGRKWRYLAILRGSSLAGQSPRLAQTMSPSAASRPTRGNQVAIVTTKASCGHSRRSGPGIRLGPGNRRPPVSPAAISHSHSCRMERTHRFSRL